MRSELYSASHVFAKSDHLGEYSPAVCEDWRCFCLKRSVCFWMSAAFGILWGIKEGVAHDVKLVDNCLFIEAEGHIFENIPFRSEAGLIRVVFELFVSFRIPIEKPGYEWGNEILICFPDCRSKQNAVKRTRSNQRLSVVMRQSIQC